MGLSINYAKDKSAVYINPAQTLPDSWDPATLPRNLPILNDGIVMVGTPIGSDDFCVDFWTEKLLDPIRKAVPLVCQWSNVQAALPPMY